MAREIFQKQAFEQLAAADDLDRPWSLVTVQAWLSLAALSILIGGALVWAFTGSIPETVTGAGVLIHPGRVRNLQAMNGGQIVELPMRVGQHVEAGAVLAVLSLADLSSLPDEARRGDKLPDEHDLLAQLAQQRDERRKIRSPVAGVIVEISVGQGQVVSAGGRLGAIEADGDDSGEGLRNLVYFPVATGKRLNAQMPASVTPATVKRERFGGIRGKILRISPYPVTMESATAAIGNPELVKALWQPGGMIEVEIELERDGNSPSGYRWTSTGPPLKFSAGTTTATRITIMERAPVTFVLPILKRS